MKMRFKRGSKVEVFSQNEVPSGSWHCAEILNGNGHYYTVKYDGVIDAVGGEIFERVSRKAIRPSPPLIQVPENWSTGDLVEVFHNFSWKTATVLRMLGSNHVSVRLHGYAQEFIVSKRDLRVRLCWQDDEWVIIGKGSSNSGDSRVNVPSTRKVNHISRLTDTTPNLYFKDDGFVNRNANNLQQPDVSPSRKQKRRSPYCSKIEACEPKTKIRVNKKESRRVILNEQHPLPKQVDDVVSSRELLDEKCIHPSFNNKLTGRFESNLERETTDVAVGCSRAVSLEHSDAVSFASSVGSCSVVSDYHDKSSTGRFDENEACSNTESFCCLRSEEGNCLLPADSKLTDEIHRLELNAYRRIVEALHASGPLSWEQEVLLTNLRDSLHISNDEHLVELRNLVAASNHS